MSLIRFRGTHWGQGLYENPSTFKINHSLVLAEPLSQSMRGESEIILFIFECRATKLDNKMKFVKHNNAHAPEGGSGDCVDLWETALLSVNSLPDVKQVNWLLQ